jgi:hypothetical protein
MAGWDGLGWGVGWRDEEQDVPELETKLRVESVSYGCPWVNAYP